MSKKRDEFFDKVKSGFDIPEIIERRPYIICMLEHEGRSGIGFSKANPIDTWSTTLGQEIAWGRAIADIWRQVEEDQMIADLEKECKLLGFTSKEIEQEGGINVVLE